MRLFLTKNLVLSGVPFLEVSDSYEERYGELGKLVTEGYQFEKLCFVDAGALYWI